MISRRVGICATRKDKDTYVSDMRICMFVCLSRQRFVQIQRSLWQKRWVAAKCHNIIGTASGTIETSSEKVTTEQDTPPSLSSTIKATIGRRQRAIDRTHLIGCIGDDAGNGHSMLIWKIRCGRVAFAKGKSRRKNGRGRNAGYMLTCLLKFLEILCQIQSRSGRKGFFLLSFRKDMWFPRHGTCDTSRYLFVVTMTMSTVASLFYLGLAKMPLAQLVLQQ